MKISELTEIQKQHLAWRLDHRTGLGLGTIRRILEGEFGDQTLVEVFIGAGMTERRAKIHATKVRKFKLGERTYR